MKFEQFQVNNKFLNSLPPEWSKFMTDVKLVKDLHTTNFDQLHAYLQQQKLPENEVYIKRECNHDPLALVANHQQTLVTIQPVKRRQGLFTTGKVTWRDSTQSQKGEGYKVLPVDAQGNGKVLNEEELEFLAHPGVAEGPVIQMVITHNAAYQADDLDAYDSDCDDFSTAKVILMANLSSYELDVLSEVPHFENTQTDMLNQSVQEMLYSKQTHLVNYPENAITSDTNIIPYSQYMLETQNAAV
nr:hypothetical protein [Tanacetum cinerariifolium]GEY93647.1 hypothetical protein [Tanacetum cinerariifolium]